MDVWQRTEREMAKSVRSIYPNLSDPELRFPCKPGRWFCLEPMRKNDLSEVLAIERASFNDPWSRASFEAEMEKDEKKREAIEKGFKEYVEKENLQPDEEGKYYVKKHGYVTPAIWAAVISTQYRYLHQPYVHPHMQSGTGYRPSCVSCACVSCACACACACAGGGAAGCSRKTLHECPACREKVREVEERIVTVDY